jgi:hypothetical protein
MSEIEIGKTRQRSRLAKLAGSKSFAIPVRTLAAHVYAVGATMGDDGLTALALHLAKPIAGAGGRILIIDALKDGQRDGGRLQSEFKRHFPAMENWSPRDDLGDIEALLSGRVDTQVAYIGSPAPVGVAPDSGSASVSALGEAVIRMLVENIGVERMEGVGEPRVVARRPLSLVILRGASIPAHLPAQMRALGIVALHLVDVWAQDPVARANALTSIRVAPRLPRTLAPNEPAGAGFDAIVEIGNVLSPHTIKYVKIDSSVLSPVQQEMSVALGSLVDERVFSWLRRRQPLALPWAAMRRNVRLKVPTTGEAPSTAMTIALARQVLVGGGRVIVIDPLAVQQGMIEPFAAQLLHAFPRMYWVEDEGELDVVARLTAGPGQAPSESIALVTGGAAAPVVRQEGEHGAIAHRPVLETMHMAVFSQLLTGAEQNMPHSLPHVLVVLRNVEMDRRTVTHLGELANGNVAVVHLDSGRLRDDVEFFCGTHVTDFADGRGSNPSVFRVVVRTAGGSASLPIEFAVDVASRAEIDEAIANVMSAGAVEPV